MRLLSSTCRVVELRAEGSPTSPPSGPPVGPLVAGMRSRELVRARVFAFVAACSLRYVHTALFRREFHPNARRDGRTRVLSGALMASTPEDIRERDTTICAATECIWTFKVSRGVCRFGS
jgi:hypothetical protein